MSPIASSILSNVMSSVPSLGLSHPRLTRSYESLDVLRHHVDLDVRSTTDLHVTECGNAQRVRDKRHLEARATDLDDGERNPIERNRSLGNQIAQHFLGGAE